MLLDLVKGCLSSERKLSPVSVKVAGWIERKGSSLLQYTLWFLKIFFNQSCTRIDLETDPRSSTLWSISPVIFSVYVKINFSYIQEQIKLGIVPLFSIVFFFIILIIKLITLNAFPLFCWIPNYLVWFVHV